jgi:hypothetical protein
MYGPSNIFYMLNWFQIVMIEVGHMKLSQCDCWFYGLGLLINRLNYHVKWARTRSSELPKWFSKKMQAQIE